MFNKMILIRRLGPNAEARTAQNNRDYIVFNLATRESWKNSKGEVRKSKAEAKITAKIATVLVNLINILTSAITTAFMLLTFDSSIDLNQPREEYHSSESSP